MKKSAPFLLSLLLFTLVAAMAPGTSAALRTSAGVTGSYGSTFKPKSTFLSAEKRAPIPFTGLGVKWHQLQPPGTEAELLVRFKTEQGWGEWNSLEGDIDGPAEADPEYPSAFLPTNRATAFQYKVRLASNDPKFTPVVENIEFTYINARERVTADSENLVASIGPESPALIAKTTAAKAASAKIKIISRSEWGADESLRLWQDDNPAPQIVKTTSDFEQKYAGELKLSKKITTDSAGRDLTWPLEYSQKVSKIIIHHTATTKNLDDPEKAIRDIYYWHAISKGWGDIGYNYIIDPKGNIYEGRYGGDGVVGAHAGKANVGSIGIAVLGNYQDNDVPQPVLDSLAALIKIKTGKYAIDPMGSSSFRGETLANIMGHRDVMSTSCPGEKLYSQLPALRAMIKGTFKPQIIDRRRFATKDAATAKKDYDFDLQKEPGLLSFKPGEKQKLQLTLKNTGSKSWGANSYIIVSNDENGRTFLRADKMIRSASTGKTVKPGTSATFSLDLQATYNGGLATFEVFPFIDGKLKVEKYISLPLQVEAPNYDYEFVKLAFAKPYLKKGETAQAKLELKNTGNTTWKRDGANRIMIGTEKPRDRVSRILPKPDTRLAGLVEREVKPGETGHFNITVKAPQLQGSYREYFAPVIEGITWMAFNENYLDLFVYDSQYFAEFKGAKGDLNFLPDETRKITLEFNNMGGVVWNKSGAGPISFRLSSSNSSLKVKSPALEQAKILPGQTAKVNLSVTAPSREGTYNFKITPKIGSHDLTALPQAVTIKVSKQSSSEQNFASAPAGADVGAAAGAGAANAGAGAASPAATASNLIRVDLGFRGIPVISANGPFKLVDGGEVISEFLKDEKVAVTYDQGKYMVKGNKTAFALSEVPRFEPSEDAILRIDNYENHPGWKPELNDNEYRGALEIHWYEDELHVVNELAVEDYLKGLAEISASEPVAKIRAVIILARSYARYYTGVARKFPGAPFDLTDDPQRSQLYLGYGFEKRNPTGIKAVNDTSELVVTYGGKIIKTPYFSSDDGRTRSAFEVWGWKDTPYLISVDDPGCKGGVMAGHGVGLSGCGSLYFANQGKTFEEIIKYYYQGVEIQKLK